MATQSSVIDSEVSPRSGESHLRVCANADQNASSALLFEHFSKVTVSLNQKERFWALCCFAFALSLTCAMALFVGAWPVVPFAGLELFLLWLAFHIIARRDGNFEHIEIEASELRVSTQTRLQVEQVAFYLPWVRLQTFYRGSELCLLLQYRASGRLERVEIGRYLDQPGRVQLQKSLTRWMRIERM
jgi:uncharacterized membrane protein